MPPFAIMLNLCGLSQREAAAFLGISASSVDKMARGVRATPDGVMDDLRALHRRQRAAADAMLAKHRELIAEHGPPETVDLTLAADDDAARARGWPCVGAHAAALALVVAALDGQRFRLVMSG